MAWVSVRDGTMINTDHFQVIECVEKENGKGLIVFESPNPPYQDADGDWISKNEYLEYESLEDARKVYRELVRSMFGDSDKGEKVETETVEGETGEVEKFAEDNPFLY